MLINNNNNNINFFVKDQYNNYPIHYVYGKYKTCVKLNNKFILQLLDFKKSRVYNDERNNTIPNISNNDVLTIKDIEDIYQGIAPEILNQTNTTIISNNRYLKNDNNDYNYDLNNLYLRIKWDLNSFDEDKIVYKCLYFNKYIFDLIKNKYKQNIFNLYDNNNHTLIDKLVKNTEYQILYDIYNVADKNYYNKNKLRKILENKKNKLREIFIIYKMR